MAFWFALGGLFFFGVTATLAWHFRLRWLGAIAALIVLITVGLIVRDYWIVTDEERLQATVRAMAGAVARNDLEALVSYVSDAPDGCRGEVRSEMPMYRFSRCVVTGFEPIVVPEGATEAKVTFMVWVDVAVESMGFNGTAGREVELTFRKEADGVWRVIDYDHRTPANPFGLQVDRDDIYRGE